MPELTLEELREEIGVLADVPIGDSRISEAMCDRLINRQIVKYDELLAEYSLAEKKMATLTGSTSTTPGADGFPANQLVSLPSDFKRLLSVFVVVNGDRYLLPPMVEPDRKDREDIWPLPTNGHPRGYSLLNPSSTSSVARLRVWPPSSQVYTYEIVYTPASAVLVADADAWTYLEGSEDFVIGNVAKRFLGQDGATQPNMIQMINERIAEARQAVANMCSRDAGVLSMEDSWRTHEIL